LHHAVVERWSRGQSVLHRRDPRVKILALVVFLVVLATTERALLTTGLCYLALLAGAILLARLPLGGVLLRSCLVLPFSGTFAVITVLSGDSHRALALLEKSYLSALAVLLLVGTTSLPGVLRGLESFGLPPFLLLVVQFLYRYLFVISEQAQHMRMAAACRAPVRHRIGRDRSRFRAAAGALAVLFARSYARADGINQSMLSRGFDGRFRTLSSPQLRWGDAAFLLVAAALPCGVRFALGAVA